MKKHLMGLAVAAASAITVGAFAPTTASAAINLVSANTCDIYDLNEGCRFSYQGNEHQDIAGIVGEYNTEIDPDLAVPDYLGKIDAEEDDPFFSADFVYDFANIVVSDGGKTWTFTNLPFDVSLFTVKAGSGELLLFGLDPAQNDFTSKNVSIYVGKAGTNLANISHVSFYGTDGGGGNVVPEPGTWALMILGFGGAGMMLRRRKLAHA